MNSLLLDREKKTSALRPALTSWRSDGLSLSRTPGIGQSSSLFLGEMQQFTVVRANAACWEGYERVPGTTEYSEDSCRKKGSGKKKKKKKRKREESEKSDKNSAKMSRENASTVPGKGGIHAKGSDAGASAVTCPVFCFDVCFDGCTCMCVCVCIFLFVRRWRRKNRRRQEEEEQRVMEK